MKYINILIVEDDYNIKDIVKKYLVKEGYTVFEAQNANDAKLLFEENPLDLIILDVMLPDSDGWTVLRKIRKESKVPVIMLTARSEEDDKLLGFDLGADDYLTKPFSVKELMARIKAILSRNKLISVNDELSIGKININTAFHTVVVSEKIVELTPLEYKLLMYFSNNLNLALTREQILNAVWGYDYFGDERTVDTHVKRLRKKIMDDGEIITTVRSVGYRMVENNEKDD